jgi:ribonucleoside-diphosphate reductase alpha chain
MAQGMPYDSAIGRMQASAIASTMTASAYEASALMASRVGPFAAYEGSFVHGVIALHRSAVAANGNGHTEQLLKSWEKAAHLAATFGVRNSYVTNIAPTGTIGLQMDCDTTGIEPELALVKTKKLVGGGEQKMINSTVLGVLRKLGYDTNTNSMLKIQENNSVAHFVAPEHLPIFATSFGSGKESIAWQAHVKMMAAVQPFISGAISKTVNMPTEATVEDVERAYMMAWKQGLKCIAIYRNGSKSSQPLSVKDDKKIVRSLQERKKLPDDRQSLTHKFSVAGHEGYITIGLYPDGTPGELFVTISKEGSFVSGLLDAWATMFSLAIQYGMPLDKAVEKLKGHSYEPQGFTQNPKIRFAKSITDYIATYLELTFLKTGNVQDIDMNKSLEKTNTGKKSLDLPPCMACGNMMIPSGSCYKCENCGSSSGCS